MAGESLHSSLRNACMSVDWVSFISERTASLTGGAPQKQAQKQDRNSSQEALSEPLVAPEKQEAPSKDAAATAATASPEATQAAKFVAAKLAEAQKQRNARKGLGRPPAGPMRPVQTAGRSRIRDRWIEVLALLLVFGLTVFVSVHLGYKMGWHEHDGGISEIELSDTLARLAAAERELGRRTGPSPQVTVALPPAIESYRDETYAARVPGAPGPAALRHHQEPLSGFNLDVYDVGADFNGSGHSWGHKRAHAPFYDGPAAWLVGEAEELNAAKADIRDEEGNLVPLERPLRVCLLTADFWGRKGAGGTATAYSLLAAALDEDPDLEVILLAVTEDWDECERSRQQQAPRHLLVDYVCLQDHHFEPPVIKTHPYERMSHAVLNWAIEHQDDCDVLQVHEWGGVFQDLVSYSHLRQFRPGMRLAINTHGGHYWSTEGQLPRPSDIMSLRIDHGERTTLELSDIVLSPTRYIMSWLRQRGWHMPANRLPLPNLIPGIEEAPSERMDKLVWRLVFFGRLEERKGIKLYVDAINRLPERITSRPNFEVTFIGAEAKVDQLRSGVWLERKTKDWEFTVNVHMNMPREQALAKLKEEGYLLVQASMIDNMPYVLAEASVNGIPLIIYDVGGVTEMIDPKLHADILVGSPRGDGLAGRLREILEAGHVQTTVLNPRVTNGKALWQAWHHDFAVNQQPGFESDDILVRDEAALMERDYDIIDVKPGLSALQLYEEVCDDVGCSDIGCGHNASDFAPMVLLMPKEFEIIDYDDMEKYVELINVARLRADDNIGALTFGAQIPEYNNSGLRLAFPTAPTWQLYEGEVEPWLMSDNCTENVPILIRRATFCGAFNADARNFQEYSSFALSLMLSQAGLRLVTFPEAPFRLNHWSSKGYQCMVDKTPDRKLDLQVAANLMNDDELMLSAQLTPTVRPFVDFVADFSDQQYHRGWVFGYADVSGQNATQQSADLAQLTELNYFPAESSQLADGIWRSPKSAYPNLHRFILHPCAGWEKGACAGKDAAAAVLRFSSYLSTQHAVFVLVYEVFPRCGDGVDFEVTFSPVDTGGEPLVLHKESHGRMDKPLRQRLHFYMDQLEAGDTLDLVALPRGNHDCDGVLILEVQLWDGREYRG